MNALITLGKGPQPFVLAALFLALPAVVHATDALFYLVGKGQEFTQADANPPVPKSKNPARFHASVGPATANSVTNATVQPLPAGALDTLSPAPSGDLEFEAKFSSLASLDAAYPDGNYQVVINAVHDGMHAITLPLNGDAYPSNAPHVSNFAATQAVQPAYPFTLEWDPFIGGTTNDFIQVTIINGSSQIVYQSPGPGQPGSLDGTATSAAAFTGIPPGSPSGTLYLGSLTFAKAATRDAISYPGVLGMAGYYLDTGFTLTTAANLPPAQDVTSYAVSKLQAFVQRDTGLPGPDLAAPFHFFAIVTPTSSNSVSNLRVQLPSGSTDALAYDSATAQFRFQPTFSSQSALDAAFGPGVYTLTLAGVHDGFRSFPLTLPVGSYPNAPHVSNFDPRQPINPAATLSLTWNPFLASMASDDVFMNVRDTSGSFYFSRKLNHAATNFTFSANTFRAGTNQVFLNFRRFITSDSNASYPAVGSVLYLSQTVLNVVAVVSPTPPKLEALPLTAAGQFQLQLIGQTNRQYVIEASSNLKAGP